MFANIFPIILLYSIIYYVCDYVFDYIRLWIIWYACVSIIVYIQIIDYISLSYFRLERIIDQIMTGSCDLRIQLWHIMI